MLSVSYREILISEKETKSLPHHQVPVTVTHEHVLGPSPLLHTFDQLLSHEEARHPTQILSTHPYRVRQTTSSKAPCSDETDASNGPL